MTQFRVRLSDFSIDYMLHCSIRPIDSLPIAQESLLNVPLKTTAKTDEINRVISTNTGMNGVTLAHHISLVTYLVFGSTNTGMNANRHQWFICTALKREKSKNPWLKRIGAILNKSTTTRPTKYPVTRSTDFLV